MGREEKELCHATAGRLFSFSVTSPDVCQGEEECYGENAQSVELCRVAIEEMEHKHEGCRQSEGGYADVGIHLPVADGEEGCKQDSQRTK